MTDAAVRLVQPTDRGPGAATPGMVREQAVATDEMWAGFVTTEAGVARGAPRGQPVAREGDRDRRAVGDGRARHERRGTARTVRAPSALSTW